MRFWFKKNEEGEWIRSRKRKIVVIEKEDHEDEQPSSLKMLLDPYHPYKEKKNDLEMTIFN